jgi:hypothetical protein
MDVFFKIVDQSDRFIGFIKDPLLNLSLTPDDVIRQSINSKMELNDYTQRYQKSLDNLLKMSNTDLNPLAKLSFKVLNNHYKNYKLGDLKVITAPTNKYL